MNRVGILGLERGVGSVCTQGALPVCTLRWGRGCPTAPPHPPLSKGPRLSQLFVQTPGGFGKAAGGGL